MKSAPHQIKKICMDGHGFDELMKKKSPFFFLIVSAFGFALLTTWPMVGAVYCVMDSMNDKLYYHRL